MQIRCPTKIFLLLSEREKGSLDIHYVLYKILEVKRMQGKWLSILEKERVARIVREELKMIERYGTEFRSHLISLTI